MPQVPLDVHVTWGVIVHLRAFAASTLGNVAGGLLTALVVMQQLAVAGRRRFGGGGS